MTSETVGVLDDITSRFVGVVGNIVDNLGDFVISTVDQLPGTIDTISRTVNSAVADGGEQVSIFLIV